MRMSGVSARMSRGCYEKTAAVESYTQSYTAYIPIADTLTQLLTLFGTLEHKIKYVKYGFFTQIKNVKR